MCIPLSSIFDAVLLLGLLLWVGILGTAFGCWLSEQGTPSEHNRQVMQIRARGEQVRAEVTQLTEEFKQKIAQKPDEVKRKRRVTQINMNE